MVYYGESVLTGRTRVRRNFFGSLILQAEISPGGWIDASYEILTAIGFEASSKVERQRLRKNDAPRDWYADDLPGRYWN
jgi:hypothetical protein